MTRTVSYFVMVVIDDSGPAGLTSSESLGSTEVFEGLMISENDEGLWYTFEIVSPDLESGYYSQELFVVDFIIEFCGDHFSRHECDWAQLLAVILRECSGDSEVRSISLDDSFESGLEVSKYIGTLEGRFDRLEGFSSSRTKLEFAVFLKEVCEGSSDTGNPWMKRR